MEFHLRKKALSGRRKGTGQGMLRPGRIFSYLVLFVLDLFLYAVLHSYFLWILAVVMAVCPFLSVWGLRRLCRSLRLVAAAGQDTAFCGEEACLEIRISNPIWFGALDSSILLHIDNTFYGTKSQVAVSMPVRMHGDAVLKLPVELEQIGRFHMECRQFAVQDLLGMVRCPVAVSASCEICVYPKPREGEEIEITGFLAGAAESEESRSRGSDFAEVSNIREYIPGDRIRDIHWKLSAKQDDLMVKERISMAGTEMMILVRFSSSREHTREILEMVYGLGQAFTRIQLPVRLLCWNQRLYAFEEFGCGLPSELPAAFGEMFRTPLSCRLSREQALYMKNCYPHLDSYLVAAWEDGTVQIRMCENV